MKFKNNSIKSLNKKNDHINNHLRETLEIHNNSYDSIQVIINLEISKIVKQLSKIHKFDYNEAMQYIKNST